MADFPIWDSRGKLISSPLRHPHGPGRSASGSLPAAAAGSRDAFLLLHIVCINAYC